MSEEKAFQRLGQRIEGLIARIEAAPDPDVRADALNLAQSLMELHGAGLDRLMEIVARTGASGYALMDDFACDDLVAGLLLLYGLHPHDLETRVMRALDETRPFLQSHGGDVELLGVTDGMVRLRLVGSCRSCSSSTMTLKLAIERAIYEAAPDVTEVVTEGQIALKTPATAHGLVQLEGVSNNGGYDQCASVGPPNRTPPQVKVKGETHG
ncbi:MAG TPA: NifU family protein [Blastocatellia bacterium]|jgi:Fe-S cluster biogenesis protein NfuA|nr:NifU family protein [Blastocatellia bacterium]